MQTDEQYAIAEQSQNSYTLSKTTRYSSYQLSFVSAIKAAWKHGESH
ncbi:MAG TPA: hypothetical protein V6C91_00650 [Coleofasciculaceae cyanobacterium]